MSNLIQKSTKQKNISFNNVVNSEKTVNESKKCSVIDYNNTSLDTHFDDPLTFDDDTSIQESTENSFAYTNAIRVETCLMKLLFDINAPNYAFKDIMTWAKDAYHSGYMFDCKSTSYESQIKHLENYSNLGY
jgi:hypothetical protein